MQIYHDKIGYLQICAVMSNDTYVGFLLVQQMYVRIIGITND